MQVQFSTFFVEIDSAQYTPGELHGVVSANDHSIAWDLTFDGNAKPLLLLPFKLYKTKLPAAKSLVSAPMATFNGSLTVNGETVEVVDWVGSQNHNWGLKHTDL